MKYLVMIHTDPKLLDALPAGEYDRMMDRCDTYAADLKENGRLIMSQRLQPAETATTLRVREGKLSTTDGPFAETKEHLAGFNLIDARDLDEAMRIASKFPWSSVGSVEVRPVLET